MTARPRLGEGELDRLTSIEASLVSGAELRRGPKTPYYYTWTPRTGHTAGGLNSTTIKKLEAAGIIERCGVDAYTLTEAGADLFGQPEPQAVIPAHPTIEQPDLFGAAA